MNKISKAWATFVKFVIFEYRFNNIQSTGFALKGSVSVSTDKIRVVKNSKKCFFQNGL